MDLAFRKQQRVRHQCVNLCDTQTQSEETVLSHNQPNSYICECNMQAMWECVFTAGSKHCEYVTREIIRNITLHKTINCIVRTDRPWRTFLKSLNVKFFQLPLTAVRFHRVYLGSSDVRISLMFACDSFWDIMDQVCFCCFFNLLPLYTTL